VKIRTHTSLPAAIILATFAFLPSARPAAAKPPVPAGSPEATPAGSPAPAPAARPPVVRVNSTNQPFDFAKPWDKKQPFLRRGTGAVIEGAKVLVTAELVADHTYIELESADGELKSPATIAAIDYDANLALLVPTEEKFLAGSQMLAPATGARVGTRAEILQIESNGDILRTPATLTTISVAPYPMESIALVTYRLTTALQTRDNSFVLPAIDGDGLLGLLMRYDSRTQSADLVPAPVISRFLENAASGARFPRAGLGFASTRDPQFRNYIGLANGDGGVYVTMIQPGSAAESAGLREGDVILSADGHKLDSEGLYDDAALGKISFTHLVSMGGGKPITLEILRGGARFPLELTPAPTDPDKIVSAPYLFDKGPGYYVLGGLVFQELNRTYLQQWGGNWRKAAPQRLVFLDAFQDEAPGGPGPRKIVFLSSVLPSPDTIGYEDLESLVVTKLNGRPVHSLAELAEAAKSPVNGFHKIEIEEDPRAIYLDAASVSANQDPLAKHYGLPALERLP